MNKIITLLLALALGAVGYADTSRTFVPGQKITFTGTFFGDQPTSFQWQKDGTDIAGATANPFVILSAKPSDTGAYTIIGKNEGGSVLSDKGIISFASLPVITTQPVSQRIGVGKAVTFSVVASGASSYQWKLNGFDLAGATSATLTAQIVVVSESGSVFTCVVTNAAGSVTSSPAILTVVSPPTSGTVTISP